MFFGIGGMFLQIFVEMHFLRRRKSIDTLFLENLYLSLSLDWKREFFILIDFLIASVI